MWSYLVLSLLYEEALIVCYYGNPDGRQTVRFATAGDTDKEMTIKENRVVNEQKTEMIRIQRNEGGWVQSIWKKKNSSKVSWQSASILGK